MVTPPTFEQITTAYNNQRHAYKGKLAQFKGVQNKDVYNPTVIFDKGVHYLAGRTESRTSHWRYPETYDPQVVFYKKDNDEIWSPLPGAPAYNMEDPFHAWLHDEDGKLKLIVGGVTVDRLTDPPIIVTQFYKGDDILSLEKEPFAQIRNMKDIRIVERKDKKTKIVCTRPQGGLAGLGKIGVTQIEKLSDLNKKDVFYAQLLPQQIEETGWLGSNQLIIREEEHDGKKKEIVHVLGHVAHKYADNMLSYYGMTFSFDADDPFNENNKNIIPKIIISRADFPPAQPKTPELQDVIFSGYIETYENGTAKVYCGISDAHVGSIIIPDPFTVSSKVTW